MRWLTTVLAAAAAVTLTGCTQVVSVNPVYSDDAPVIEPAVVGVWEADEGADTWIVRDSGAGAYTLVVSPKKATDPVQILDIRLVRIGGQLFADGTERKDASIPGHFMAMVSIQGDNLSLTFPDGEWLTKRGPEFPLPAYSKTSQALVITAPTAEVQAFLTRCAATPGCFSDPGTFHRLR